MKKILLLLVAVLTLSSCNFNSSYYDEPITLNDVLSSSDIWYIDYNSKTGNGEIPFLSIAFTISFLNGDVYANNNLVGIGQTGNGYGVRIGNYDTFESILTINHSKYGHYEMEVIQLSDDKIRLVDRHANATYDLEGYQKKYFNFDGVFYDNIEYFLQEYV
ncbi:MAG: lipoprotein, partial [Flavobacteriaceae bacterium]|nr:lipoprotein [Flavobacteriaceae bacterium]